MKRAIISADDFGMSIEVNEAVEYAHRHGLLSTTSLMVAGQAAQDAVARAQRMPSLRVGLHLVVIEGPAVLSHEQLSLITDTHSWFSSSQFWLGVEYFFHPTARQQLAREITAQFKAFARTGLPLDHANAHKHMHLHPTVGQLMITIGKQYGLNAIRIPQEPLNPLFHATGIRSESLGNALLRQWTRLLRYQSHKAGIATNDWCFGLAWSGHMITDRVAALASHLPDGVSEIYFHPATQKNTLLNQLMPTYEHQAELEALCSEDFKNGFIRSGTQLCGWQDIVYTQQYKKYCN
ncbi:MAG: hopanoid biosynthesis-associated protein HpnK [Acetobacter sp.]|nr:hopanoid biosynthesis-associated protein HpnK [Acetobacter sp.]